MSLDLTTDVRMFQMDMTNEAFQQAGRDKRQVDNEWPRVGHEMIQP